ncbi:MAG: hypothetical protein WBC19_14365 [Pyrinomonadaceae bacterium]|nr:hypothetical protein [Pyrinomonadaceae bacterium]
MDLQKKIISVFANRECHRISNSVIRRLQKLKGDSLLSGDDSILVNTWDEICVQIQGDRSYYWDTYVLTIQHFVAVEVDKLTSDVQMPIWLQTDNGLAWDSGCTDPETIFEDVVNYIVEDYVFDKAGRWSNRRIEWYIYHP